MKNIKHILILFLLLNLSLFAYSSKVTAAYAIGVFDEQGNGENIQHIRKTKNDYNGTCYSKIVVFGKLLGQTPKVNIGSSKGHYMKSIPIYNRNKIKIAQEMTFKHYNLKKGYFEVRVGQKLFDTKVFVK